MISSPIRQKENVCDICVCLRVIGMLSPDEMGLFQKRIRLLDKKIQPGLTKILWSSLGASNIFTQDCVLHVDKVETHFNRFSGGL